MKILLVITKAEIGGAQVFVLNLAKSLNIQGFQVEVAAGLGEYLPEELKKYNIIFHRLHSLKRDYSLLNSVYFIWDLFRLLKKGKYEIVHLNSTNTLIGALSAYFLFKRPKLIFTLHGLSFLDANYIYHPLINFISKQYFKIFLKFIDKSVLVCKNNLDSIKNSGFIRNYSLIYNGLDTNGLEYLAKNESRNYFSDICNIDLSQAFIVGSTGRLAYPKNYEFLITNFRQFKEKIPNLKIIIIGEGPNSEKYKKLILENNLEYELFLLGEIKDSYKYTKGFDIFTLTSNFEGLSISLIEALFAEIPLLASEVGGNPEVVNFDTRQLFKLNDAEDYLTKLLEILDNQESIVKYNKQLKEKFSLIKMKENYVNIYKELLNKNSTYPF